MIRWKNDRMNALSLREARTYAALAVAVGLTASAGLGVLAGAVVGAAAAVASVTASVATVRVLVNRPS